MSPMRGLSPPRLMGRSPGRTGFDRGPPEGAGPPGRLGQSRLGAPGGRRERTVWIGQVACRLHEMNQFPCLVLLQHTLSKALEQ